MSSQSEAIAVPLRKLNPEMVCYAAECNREGGFMLMLMLMLMRGNLWGVLQIAA